MASAHTTKKRKAFSLIEGILALALFAAVCKSGTGKSRVAAGYLLTLVTVMYCKNILSYIRQGGYENTTIWNYPYFSIFDPAEIREFRSIPEQFLFWQ